MVYSIEEVQKGTKEKNVVEFNILAITFVDNFKNQKKSQERLIELAFVQKMPCWRSFKKICDLYLPVFNNCYCTESGRI